MIAGWIRDRERCRKCGSRGRNIASKPVRRSNGETIVYIRTYYQCLDRSNCGCKHTWKHLENLVEEFITPPDSA